MKLSETENVYPVELTIEESVVSNELRLNIKSGFVALDQQTAAEFLPILQHFIATGELSE